MGIHLEMTGQGCRQFDESSGCWQKLFSHVFYVGGHFSRIDIALDDHGGLIPFTKARQKYYRHEVRSMFKKGTGYIDVNFAANPENDGHTLYFGKPKSDIKIRIYDKAAKQRVEGPWIRTEVECHHKHADVIAHHLCNTEDQCSIVAGILKKYVSFVEQTTDKNKARWPISPWWKEFLGEAEKLSLTSKKMEINTMQKVENYLYKQAAPYLALYVKANGGDFGCIERLISHGDARLKDRHLALLGE